MIQQTELINLDKAKKLILLAKYFEDEIQAKAVIDTLDDIQLNKWFLKNLDEINRKLREESLTNGKCWKCGKPLHYSSFNEGDNYAIECLNCDILYDED